MLDGRQVRLTNLGKLLYPAAGFTKAHLIDYYVRAAPFLLPHFRNRPVTLKRYPNGIGRASYWEKDAPSFTPPWVETCPTPRRAGGPDIRYIMIQDRATLAWVANIASIELHPFLHRKPNLLSPDFVVFDLDPGEGATMTECIRVAFLLRKLFQELRLEAFPKVSGGKGLQLYLPLNTGASYSVTQPFAHAVAELITRQAPDLAVAEMAKAKRNGKVFLDWSQNADFKTTAGVCSVRAKGERPSVSMPVTWEELELAQQSGQILRWEPAAALDRLERLGDLFAPLLTLKQELPDGLPKAPAATKPPVRPAVTKPTRSRQGTRRRFAFTGGELYLETVRGFLVWKLPQGLPRRTRARVPAEPAGKSAAPNEISGVYEYIEGGYEEGAVEFSFRDGSLDGEYRLARDRSGEWSMEKLATETPASKSTAADRARARHSP